MTTLTKRVKVCFFEFVRQTHRQGLNDDIALLVIVLQKDVCRIARVMRVCENAEAARELRVSIIKWF
jgi:hypothetical protein